MKDRNTTTPQTTPELHSTPSLEGVFRSLLPELQRAVAEAGYLSPTPIQSEAIPHLLQGRDLIGCAQTGTGKTAAFMLPLLQLLAGKPEKLLKGRPRVLVLAPTRELAAQIGDSTSSYGRHLPFRHTVIFGGVGQNPQTAALNKGLHILVATPGRLLDLIGQGFVSLENVETFILDEADRMLDMGFLPDIRRVIALLPSRRQTLFFSATMEPEVIRLARTLVQDPVHITITPESPAVEKIAQKVLFVDGKNKDALLAELLTKGRWERAIVFTQMKHMANKVAKKLEDKGIAAAAIHGNKSQGARTEALRSFKEGRIRVLVATDIAARGLDIDSVSHVINYDLPIEPETYVHRIGRTARAGASGIAISFCSASEREALRSIERFLLKEIPQDIDHRFHCEAARTATGADARPAPKATFTRRRRPENRERRSFASPY